MFSLSNTSTNLEIKYYKLNLKHINTFNFKVKNIN